MPQNFIECDRDQELLLPPSMREWLPEGHLAWFVADAVQELDLAAFYGSSRGIERRCREDVAFRVLAANQTPDHATIARFRTRHEQALADTFTRCWHSARRRAWSRSGWLPSTAA